MGLLHIARKSARSAACCDTDDAFDVVCDWNAVIALETATGAMLQPIRQPVIAYALATPLITIRFSRVVATSSADWAPPS